MTEERSIIKAVQKVAPAVVSIVMSKTLRESPLPFAPFGLGSAPLAPQSYSAGLDGIVPSPFEPPPEDPQKSLAGSDSASGPQEVKISGGSGFFVSPDGLILTNRHVVQDPEAKYTVLTNDDRQLEAKVAARDSLNDVAVLKVEVKNALAVELGNSLVLELGQTVITIGNALGMFQNTVSKGVISGLSRAISAQSEISGEASQLRGLIQTDAAINPGNSGGPLIDASGRAVGINTAVVFGAENIGFAIPIDAAKRDLETLKKYGEITHPSLGVRYVSISQPLKERFKLPVEYGAWVVREGNPWDVAVLPGGPADQAGVKENDIILEFNGEKLTEKNSLIDCVERSKIGENVTLKVLSSDKERELKVRLTKRQ